MPLTPAPRNAGDLVPLAVTAGLLALALLIALTGGFALDVGGWRLGLRGWIRPAGLCVLLLALPLLRRSRADMQWADYTSDAARTLLLGLALAGIGWWLVYLVDVCGGSDSYGYVSASQRLLAGALIEPEPIASWLPVSDPLYVATPAGYVPAAGGLGTAPTYPLGLPALMALATWLVGSTGPYLVAPVCGCICVLVAARLCAHWYGSLAGWTAASVLAWQPLVATYAKQAMSDIPATMWSLLALWWLREPGGRPLLAGIATGLSFVTRPGGIGVVAVLVAVAGWTTQGRWTRWRWFAVGAVPFALFQAWLQWHLYGSPWMSGYGSVTSLYAGASVIANARIYGLGIVSVYPALWFVGLAAATVVSPGRPMIIGLAMLVLSAIPYLLYFEFDHWETLRFLLPALTALTIASAGGLAKAAQRWKPPAAAIAIVVCASLSVASSLRILADRGVAGTRAAELRYPRVAALLSRTTPENAVIFAAQHSGSIRHYARRQTLRWDVLRVEDLEPALTALEARGLPTYVALEGTETTRFERQFAAPLSERVRRLPAGQVGNVQVWQLEMAAR